MPKKNTLKNYDNKNSQFWFPNFNIVKAIEMKLSNFDIEDFKKSICHQ